MCSSMCMTFPCTQFTHDIKNVLHSWLCDLHNIDIIDVISHFHSRGTKLKIMADLDNGDEHI